MAYGTTKVDNIQSSTASTPVVFKDGNGTEIGTLCRAWVNFNGVGTVAIRGSFNVSSITDNGTGDYTVNFTTAMPDVNYSIAGMCPTTGGLYCKAVMLKDTSITSTSSVRIYTAYALGTAEDSGTVAVAIFR